MIELAANAPAVGDYNGDMNGIELLDSMGARVVLLMKHKRLSGKELAKHVGVSEVFVSQIINQGKEPSTAVLRKLVRALDTTADFLLCLSDTPHPVEVESVCCRK